MAVWFTADTHFGHINIIKYCGRPFRDIWEMDEELVRRWNSVVTPEDTVYHLGDVAMGKLPETLQTVKRLNGKKFLVPGNHDACNPNHPKFPSQGDIYREVGFEVLGAKYWLHLNNGCAVELSHEGIIEHHPWGGAPLVILHGHTHSKERTKDRKIHVGVDAWDFYPVSENEVASLAKEIYDLVGEYETRGT